MALVALQQLSPQCCPRGKPAPRRRAGQEGLAGNCSVCVGLEKKTSHLTPPNLEGRRKEKGKPRCSGAGAENRPGEKSFWLEVG